ncbi:MAG: isochorismate synthase [Acidimicrobiaceae bacterium]|nr:isochorismate synthase [Acidimicrobiaceae bacterium]
MPDSVAAVEPDQPGRLLDRAELAERAAVPGFVVDLAVDAGLITPLRPRSDSGGETEGFTSDHVEMLAAARTLIDAGVAVEEMAALAMRHATNVENLIDDSIEVLKRSINHSSHDRAELIESVNRLIPVATKLVIGHFERTLFERAMARIGDEPASAACAVVVAARRARRRIDPLAVYAAAVDQPDRCVWLRPGAGLGVAALGVAEEIAPVGDDRFSAASAARAVLAARLRRHGPDDAPAPLVVGGFSFTSADARCDAANARSRTQGPVWEGFGDCRLVLPEATVLDRPDGTWLLAAARASSDGDEAAAVVALQQRLDALEAEAAAATGAAIGAAAVSLVESDEQAAATAERRSGRSVGRSVGLDAEALQVEHPYSAPAESSTPSSESDNRATQAEHQYKTLVRRAVDAVRREEFEKVVLARAVAVDRGIDVAGVLDRLRSRNPDCATFAFTVGQATFLGSTPEELVTLRGSRLDAVALAGTAPRGRNRADDEKLAAELLASVKNRREHRIVVEGVIEALSRLGLVDPAPAEPGLLRLNRVQHLRTPITAEVKRRRTGASDMDVLRAAGALHPTAAVGGAPSEAALEFIARNEGFDRGWYSAPVGWCDLDGNGELGVALRCALARPGTAHLFAGAGIVSESDPDDELAETTVKLQAFLDALD